MWEQAVPRYYFDTDDGDGLVADEDGQDVASAEELRFLALDALPDIVREVMPDGDETTFSIKVRDASGEYLFEATLALKSSWLRRPA